MLFRDIRAASGSEFFFVFQQNNVPSHSVKDKVALQDQETPDFILPALWPPNLLDLNPFDYTVWSVLQERVYRIPRSRTSTNRLKRRINGEWATLSRTVIELLLASGVSVYTRLRSCWRRTF